MNTKFFVNSSYCISKLMTQRYSTSFSFATSLLEKEQRQAIYAVYGFVRLADEIVDSLHDFDRAFLLKRLHTDLHYALKHGISTNPILVSFVDTVKKYNINQEHIEAFMKSMAFDLTKKDYIDATEMNQYIYGSADVVGLMCLKIFCNGDEKLYQKLETPAQKLGSAFQKVNFLRDLKEDIGTLQRSYFPEISNGKFNEETKRIIESSIGKDFEEAWEGIKQLPMRSKLAVSLAYHYYLNLFKKITRTSAEEILEKRVRISNFTKYMIMTKTSLLYRTNLI